MNGLKTLTELKKEDLRRIKKRPAISVFRDNMSLGTILEKAYITPKYHLRKHDTECVGVTNIYKEYFNKNVAFIGEGGVGKTLTFLRLYVGIDECINSYTKEFYYCFAPDLFGSKRTLNNYQKELRKKIEKKNKLDGILLIDGMEEAFLSNSKSAGVFLQKLNHLGFTIWVSCRTNFYKRLDDETDEVFDEKIDVKSWDEKDFEVFVSQCLVGNEKREIIEERIKNSKTKIKEMLCRPLFATMILFVAENDDLEDIDNEYELIEFFLYKWLERDKRDKKHKKHKGKSVDVDYSKLREIALKVYLKDAHRPLYDTSLSAFRDLFVMTNNRQGTIHGFLHREFLIYFIVNALLDAALNNTQEIIKWYSQTFYDDITNVIKPVLLKLTETESKKFYRNLFLVYKSTYENGDEITNSFRYITVETKEEVLLKLRDEILYFVFRLPYLNYDEFARYAYNKYLENDSREIMIFLGIAYGMAISTPNNNYTFEFAKKLVPGTEEEVRNRGWGMCFFGDVDEDGYKYLDNERKPWTKVRENRLKRLLDDKKKYVTRLLDIPLLYCYYYSRDFRECNSYREYSIIKNSVVNLSCFSEEQKEFLKQKKKLLVDEYLNQLLRRELHNSFGFEEEKIMGDNPKDKEMVMVKIEKRIADKMIEQSKYAEEVKNNIKAFWAREGELIIEKYSDQLRSPAHKNITQDSFWERLNKCLVIIISANSVEGAIVSARLKKEKVTLDAYPYEGHLFQFATLSKVPVCHIWPSDTSSFTQFGSFSALNTVLEIAKPRYVMSVGVAFGADPNNQLLGDVLVSKELVFYDHFNKVTNGMITLNPHEVYRIDTNLSSQLHQLETNTPPKNVGSFKWHYGCMLSGGTVLSDVAELSKIKKGASDIGYNIIGGEMEASGIYYACQKQEGRSIPFLIIKGICDWGANKNGWEEIVEAHGMDNETIKDCVQAYACDNAFSTLYFILKQLNYHLDDKTQS